MKLFHILSAIIFLGMLDISCSACKKEIHTEQTGSGRISEIPPVHSKAATADTISSTALLQSASAAEDTVTGMLYVTGNEPFARLTLFVSLGTVYRVEADSSLKSQLWQLQGKRIGVIGMKKFNPMGTQIDVSSFHLAQ